MAGRRDPGLQRYLLDGERVVVAMHQHWGKVAGPVAAAVAGLVLAVWVHASVAPSWAMVVRVTWIAWLVLFVWTLWQLFEWRHDWFVATDKRLLLTYGLISRRVAMMPLTKVTDMSYSRSIPGRILGYGQFIMESAGQDQALHDISWVPDPDHTYRAICAEMFGVDDHDRVQVGNDDDTPLRFLAFRRTAHALDGADSVMHDLSFKRRHRGESLGRTRRLHPFRGGNADRRQIHLALGSVAGYVQHQPTAMSGALEHR